MDLTHKPKFEAGELINFAIILNHTQELIGSIGLIMNKRFNHAELGYWTGKKYWNNGYCTEATRAMFEFAFNQLDLIIDGLKNEQAFYTLYIFWASRNG